MKNKYKIMLTLAGMFFLAGTPYAQKTYVNKDWDNSTGKVGNIHRTVSAVDSFGNLIVVGNTMNQSSNSDVLITKYNPHGQVLWEKTYDGSGSGNDYGVQLKINASNEIFVASAIEEQSSMDFGLLKYSPSGNLLWASSWDGPANGMDIPADLDIDQEGSIYLVGGTESLNTFSDYAIVKFDANGGYLWHNTYDYANLHDAATSIAIHSNNIVVSGASASAFNSWDYATLIMDKSDGTINDVKRTVVSGVGLDNVVAVTSDANNNTYITGYVEINGNRNIQTLKINGNFDLEWVKNFDGGLEDVGRAIGVDDFGNVYITGTKENSNGGKDYITIKYSSDGTELWQREFGSSGSDNIATAEHLAITNQGDVIVTGTLKDENDTKEFATIKYTTDGDVKFVQKFDAGSQENEAKSVTVRGDDIFVSGISKINGVDKNATVKYSSTNRVVEPRIVNGVESHAKGEIIVRFDESAIIHDAVNRRGFNYGTLSDFVQPNVINDLQNVYPEIPWGRAKTYKIFRHFTTADSVFVNRLGDEVKIEPFWAILLIDVGKEDEVNVCNVLNTGQPLFPSIKYAHTNGFVELLVDDPYFSSQHSLVSATYPNGHINIEPAWEIETGSDKIKVGVIDSGVKWDHDDFGGFFNGSASKIKGGYDYEIDQSLEYTSNHGDPIVGGNGNGHGTKVAGIIGALRNNNDGISGIAGGNWPYENVIPGDGTQPDPNPVEHNIGVSIHGFRAIEIGLTATEVTEAMLDASTWTSLYPQSMDIINNSWKRNVPYSEEVPIITTQNMYKDAQRQIFRNGVINVCSRGNEKNQKEYFPAYAEREEWVLSIGGTDKNGYKHSNSSYGGDVDIVAPYDSDIIYTINNNSTNSHGSFDGTSAAAAHVSGVAALMLSHIDWQPSTPNNLAPDDVEFLLQRYANDRDFATYGSNYSDGYDDYSGWGLLDAGAVMQKIDRTEYIVKHVKKELPIPANLSNVPKVTGDFFFSNNDLAHGKYHGTIYEISYTLDNNLNGGDIILDYWPLNSYTTLLDNQISPTPTYIDRENANYITSMSNNSGDVKGTIIHLTQKPNGDPIDYWYPASPGNLVRVGYTLHLESDYAGVDEEDEQIFNLSCYPNPSSNNVTINFVLSENSDVQLEIFDINGRLVYNRDKSNFTIGAHSININSTPWSKGMYFIKLKANETGKTIKFVKQ
ncbi:MAG: S8 family serine peptidase [Brumimicrobium sp.]|nr:S8 family serine peptidase [Brumimicrobium sp.]